MSSQRFRQQNRKAIAALEEAGTYNETLRNVVEQLGIFGERGKVRNSKFVFQDIDGNQRSADEIINRLSKQEIVFEDLGNGKIVAHPQGLINDARPNSKKKGIHEVDIKDIVRPHDGMDTWSPQTMSGVNPNDPVHRARFLPDEELPNSSENVQRAANIGLAEATGDLKQIFDANTMYNFSLEEAEKVGDRILVGNKTLNQFLGDKGINVEGRMDKVIDPETGVRVADMSKEDRLAFKRKRGIQATKRWMDMGGRSVGDGYDEIHVPGFHAQMEHQNPFSQSIDVVGPEKSNYLSDSEYNKVGNLERYENAEKNDLDTVDYHRARRAALIAKDNGIDGLSLNKGAGPEAVDTMIADAIPSVSYIGAGRKANREAIIDTDATMKALEITKRTQALYDLNNVFGAVA